jgi:hypothetical protein
LNHRRETVRPVPLALVLLVVAGLLATGCASSSSRDGSSAATTSADRATAPGPSGSGGDARPTTTSDIGTLPQTQDRPSSDSEAFRAQAETLWQATVADDPDRAMAFFFPLSAYRQVKALPDPAADWRNRLVAAFRRDIHHLHQRLGADAGSATFVSLDVPDADATWVEPGQEVNKLGYWRVYGTVLRYQVGGVTHEVPIYSLISWRGTWFVVHVTHP